MPNTVLITPEGRNILRGISRECVMEELCPQLGMTVLEKNIETYDVYTADEAFMTGTHFCMLPVTSINGSPIGAGSIGDGFCRMLAQSSSNMGVDISGQITRWDSEGTSLGESSAPTPYRFKSK